MRTGNSAMNNCANYFNIEIKFSFSKAFILNSDDKHVHMIIAFMNASNCYTGKTSKHFEHRHGTKHVLAKYAKYTDKFGSPRARIKHIL